MHIVYIALGCHCFKEKLLACSTPSHYHDPWAIDLYTLWEIINGIWIKYILNALEISSAKCRSLCCRLNKTPIRWRQSEEYWNGNVAILGKFSPLAALEVVFSPTSSAANNDENVLNMTTVPFQRGCHSDCLRSLHVVANRQSSKLSKTEIQSLWQPCCFIVMYVFVFSR